MNASFLAALSVIGLLIETGYRTYGYDENSSQIRWSRWATFLIGSIAAVNILGVLLFDIALKRFSIPRILRDLLMAIAYVIIGVVLLARLGVDLTGIVATSAVLTAVIGFALQDTLINLVGGIALEMENTVNAGDWIRVDRFEGRVKEIRWRQTSIETRDWDTVVLPNSMLIKGPVVVLGHIANKPVQHRQWVYFNVDFRFEPATVIAVVEDALRAEPIPDIATEPPIHCLTTEFHESYIGYAVRYWLTDLMVTDPTNSVVRTRIFSALRRAEIPLSIPAQSVFVSNDDPEHRRAKLEKETERRVSVLRNVELFASLNDAEIRELAESLRVAPFVHGEAITRQGAEAHWLYILTRGSATVRVSVDDSALSKVIATLDTGDFFGEMGMMTGERRTATVIAATDAECYCIDHLSFEKIIRRRPEIAEDISHVLAARRFSLEAAREGLNEKAAKQRFKATQGDLLKRIRTFFSV